MVQIERDGQLGIQDIIHDIVGQVGLHCVRQVFCDLRTCLVYCIMTGKLF